MKPNSWLKRRKVRFYDWISRTFKDKPDQQHSEAGSEKESDKEKEIRQTQEFYDKFIAEFKDMTSLKVEPEKLTEAINGFQMYEITNMRGEGYRDGLNGVQNKSIRIAANAKAKTNFGQIKSVVKGNCARLTAQIKSRNDTINSYKEEIAFEKKFNDRLTEVYRTAHRHFSKPIGWFYIVMGLAMMIADLPISLGISTDFTGLIIESEKENSFGNLITKPDSIMFALGITFLGIYFKIMYDDYMNEGIIRRKSKQKENEGQIVSRHTVRRAIQFAIKVLILGCLIYFLYSVGTIRNLNMLDPEEALTDKELKYKLLSFVGSTILLPLISGIALSVGMGILSNIRSYKNSTETLAGLRAKIEQEYSVIFDCEAANEALLKFEAEWNTHNPEQEMAAQLESAYLQGYKHGHRHRFGYDVYHNANALYIDSINS